MSAPILHNTQYWLATVERDQYGNAQNPVLHDGPHDSKEGVAKAKMLYDRIFKREEEWVMITVGPVRPYGLELDDRAEEDIELLAGAVEQHRIRRGIPNDPPELTPEQEETLAYLHGYPGEDAFGSK